MSEISGLSVASRVLPLVRDKGRATVTEMARSLSLSRTSVETAVADLRGRGLIAEATTRGEYRGAGRPARQFEFRGSLGAVVGIDVGSASVRVAVTDLAGRVLQQSMFPGVGTQPDGASMLAAVVRGARETLTSAGVWPTNVRAIGVALPAIVDESGRVIRSVVLPEWSGIDIASHLELEFSCPVAIDGGVRLAAIAEHHIGACRLVGDVIYLSVGNRIAMASILNGKIRRGSHNVAGDIGRLAFHGLDPTTGQIRWKTAETAAAVFERARAGDADSQSELDQFIEDLAHGIALLIMTIDPEMVVIGGGLSKARGQLLEPLRRALAGHTGLPFEIPLVEARLGAEAAAHGALVHAFREHATRIYGIDVVPAPAIIPLPIYSSGYTQAWPPEMAVHQ